jgi:hypothetical protein
MHTYLLGVRELWAEQTVFVQPDDGGILPKCNGLTYTSWGPLKVNWTSATGQWLLDLPNAPKFTLKAPTSCQKSLQIVIKPKAATVKTEASGELSVTNGSGQWTLQC